VGLPVSYAPGIAGRPEVLLTKRHLYGQGLFRRNVERAGKAHFFLQGFADQAAFEALAGAISRKAVTKASVSCCVPMVIRRKLLIDGKRRPTSILRAAN
jgi:hypothetical protein